MPSDVAWPKDAAGRPMHHIFQIECAELPNADPDFPQTGMLFLFITGNYDQRNAPSLGEDEGASAIIYVPSKGDKPIEHPAGTPSLGEYSYAIEQVIIKPTAPTPAPKPKGFLSRLFNKQPKAYSKSGKTGYFAPVALKPVLFDSHPNTDPMPLFDAMDVEPNEETAKDGVRPLQMLGYAPYEKDLSKVLLDGHRFGSIGRAKAAYKANQERRQSPSDTDDVMLFQLATNEVCNLNLINQNLVIKFVISRADLKARAFGKHRVTFETVNDDGRWRTPMPERESYIPPVKDRRAGVVLKPLVPGEPQSVNQFFGWPQLPPNVSWPRNNSDKPYYFLMQLDCSTIPRSIDGLDLPPFPSSGTVFLFVDAHGQNIHFFHVPQDISGLPSTRPPDDLPPLKNRKYERPFFGFFRETKIPEALCDHEEDVPERYRTLPSKLIAPSWEPGLPFAPVPYVGFTAPSYEEEINAAIDADFAKVLPHDPQSQERARFILSWMTNWTAKCLLEKADDRYYFRNGVQSVPESFPWRWSDIRESIEAYFDVYRFKYQDEDDADDKHDAREILWGGRIDQEAREWFVRVSDKDPLARIPHSEAVAYRDWLKGLDAAGTKVPNETANESREELSLRIDLENAFFSTLEALATPPLAATGHFFLHDATADDIPAEIRTITANQLRYDRSYTLLTAHDTHHAPSPHILFEPKHFDNASEKDVLLLTFSSGFGLTTCWDDYRWLELWISPEDLEAGRFENVTSRVRW